MSLIRNFEEYKEEIELIKIQNRVEYDLYSIIAQLIRESKYGGDISLRDVSSRRGTRFSRPFMGYSGFPDFVIRTRDKNEKAEILGAIEAKYITADLNSLKNIKQLQGHIRFYKRVLYTNGIIWRFYDSDITNPIWEIQLGEIIDKTLIWYDVSKWEELLRKIDQLVWKKHKEE